MTFLVLGKLGIRNVDGVTVPIRRLKHRQLPAALLLGAGTPVSNRHLRGRRASWNGDLDTAHHHFEQALGLWRGEPLLDERGTPALDDAAARLSEEYLAVLEELSEIQFSLGRYREAVSGLRAATDANPLRERLWGQLMLGLSGAGFRDRRGDGRPDIGEAAGGGEGNPPVRARQTSHGTGQGHDPLRARNRSTRSVIVDRSRPVSSSTRRMR
ncbi:tetratricopeptide (TPR) repeat protein [Streptosporangium album]|uniref:Tetratricopeptide (TPR) repeat protein n=1 Tax=Streptosporangium album TaxID=47479 RepID=A0A7W7WBT9_9ACTN|nr:AfsR/SARP family transcriptional regulator [Streptosporangium album]MBB4941128.1 tetratricopeptide (TPR) repeat protein [Streptosporangium album]